MSKKPFKITEVWAFVTIDPKDGDEGIPAFSTGGFLDRMMMPLVCADKDRVISMIPWAKKIAAESGHKIKLVRFHNMEVIEEDIVANKLDPEIL